MNTILPQDFIKKIYLPRPFSSETETTEENFDLLIETALFKVWHNALDLTPDALDQELG